jgi:hypothetical protein
MILSFVRSTGDQLEIEDDGTFGMRRANGASSAGWFAGRLDAALSARLRGAVTAAEGGGRPDRDKPWASGATTETLFGAEGEVLVELDAHEELPPPWTEAVALSRRLLDELTSQPVAAIQLEVTDSPLAARLRHVGRETIVADLEDATVEAYLSGPDSTTLGSWSSSVDPRSASGGSVTPGWETDLGLAATGFTMRPGRSCQVDVSFTLRERRALPASVSASVSAS